MQGHATLHTGCLQFGEARQIAHLGQLPGKTYAQLRRQQFAGQHPQPGMGQQLLRRLVEAGRQGHGFVLTLLHADHRLHVEQ
ncbi:hypothetical protein D9M71_658680 [compost metagenome]